MINNINFNGGLGQSPSPKDIENLAKYVVGSELIKEDYGPTDGMGLMLGFTGVIEGAKIGKWAYNEHKNGNLSNAFNAQMKEIGKDFAEKRTLFSNGNWRNADTYKGLWNQYEVSTLKSAIPDNLSKLEACGTKNSKEALDLYNSVKDNIGKKPIGELNLDLAKANSLAHGQVPREGFFSKTFGKLADITGITKLNGLTKELAASSPNLARIAKLGKGTGLFLAFEGLAHTFTQIIPSFTELGVGSGLKQTAKSTVKVGASVGGWVAGAAAGAAVGSVIPGAGTLIGGAVGALCGIAGGLLGSWGASKVADAVVGENELDIAKEKQAKDLARQVALNPQLAPELTAAATQKMQLEGVNTESDKMALASLQHVAANQNGETSNGTKPAQTQVATGVNPLQNTDTPAQAPVNNANAQAQASSQPNTQTNVQPNAQQALDPQMQAWNQICQDPALYQAYQAVMGNTMGGNFNPLLNQFLPNGTNGVNINSKFPFGPDQDFGSQMIGMG